MNDFEKVKEIITEHYNEARCGLFFVQNVMGDNMYALFSGERITVYICYDWLYFEVLGLNESEKVELCKLYESLSNQESEVQ